jgi:hypothetical protein
MTAPAPVELRLLAALNEARTFLEFPSVDPEHVVLHSARGHHVDAGRLALLLLVAHSQGDRARAWLREVEAADDAIEHGSASSLSPRQRVIR